MLWESHGDGNRCHRTHAGMETGVMGLTLGWKQVLWDSHGDGNRCHGTQTWDGNRCYGTLTGMETGVMGLSLGWKQMLWDSHGAVEEIHNKDVFYCHAVIAVVWWQIICHLLNSVPMTM